MGRQQNASYDADEDVAESSVTPFSARSHNRRARFLAAKDDKPDIKVTFYWLQIIGETTSRGDVEIEASFAPSQKKACKDRRRLLVVQDKNEVVGFEITKNPTEILENFMLHSDEAICSHTC